MIFPVPPELRSGFSDLVALNDVRNEPGGFHTLVDAISRDPQRAGEAMSALMAVVRLLGELVEAKTGVSFDTLVEEIRMGLGG